jgi:hypothetical protein
MYKRGGYDHAGAELLQDSEDDVEAGRQDWI